MADSALTPDPLERYGAIERAYCEERWMAVIHDGQALLADLAHAVPAPPDGLRERLQLLIGHAFLYGLGDRDSAEDLYQAVLRSGAQADLRQIAEQGLEQCTLPVSPAPSSALEEEPLERWDDSSGSLQSGGAAGAQDAAVWDSAALSELAAEPESAPRSEPEAPIQDGWGAAAREDGPEPAPSTSSDALGWLTPEATAAPQDGAASPVMPWLEDGGAAPEPSSQPWSPPDESLPVQAPAAAAEPSRSEAVPAWPVEADLSPETVASLQATAAAVAAAFGQQLGGTPPTVVFMAQTPAAADSGADLASAAGERLVPDVVEEPELLEVPQAAASGQEELVLPLESQTPQASSVLDVTATVMAEPAAAEAAAALQPGTAEPIPAAEPVPPLLSERRQREPEPLAETPAADLQNGVGSMVEQRREVPIAVQADESMDGSVPPPADAEAAAEPAAAVAAEMTADASAEASAEAADPFADHEGPAPRPAGGQGPFSAPPQPVAEEDSELLMGLLRVEMG